MAILSQTRKRRCRDYNHTTRTVEGIVHANVKTLGYRDDIRRQGTLMVGKLALGHGILRPESACKIVTS